MITPPRLAILLLASCGLASTLSIEERCSDELSSCGFVVSNFGCDDDREIVEGMCPCTCSGRQAVEVEERCSELSTCRTVVGNFGCGDERRIVEGMCPCTCSGRQAEVVTVEERCSELSSCGSVVRNFGCDDDQGIVKGMCPCTCSGREEIQIRSIEKRCSEKSTCGSVVGYFGCEDDRGIVRGLCPCSCGSSDEESVGQVMQRKHNELRRLHGVPDLAYDTGLEASSAAFCSQLARENAFYHSDKSNSVEDYGENLYWSLGTAAADVPEIAVQKWYDEIELYDFNSPGFNGATGHFTQVVWAATEKVGCAVSDSSENPSGKIYACCQYTPPGNWGGQYEANVPRPL